MPRRIEQQPQKGSWTEKGVRFYVLANAVGAVAFTGAGLALGSEILVGYGLFNAAQAVAVEGIYRLVKNRRKPANQAATHLKMAVKST